MSCNCNCENCKCNDKCGQPSSEIKVYGTLVNATVNSELANNIDPCVDPDPCKAKNEPANDVEKGHNDALAYAYQIHDGRFKQDDTTLQPWERFQDEINKRVTDIVYDPTGAGVNNNPITIIENPYTHNSNGDLVPIGNSNPYDDQWLKDIIGTTPSGKQASQALLQGDFPSDESGDIIAYIRLLKAKIDNLQQQINNLPSGGGECLWKTVGDHVIPVDESKKVYGRGFYDTEVV